MWNVVFSLDSAIIFPFKRENLYPFLVRIRRMQTLTRNIGRWRNHLEPLRVVPVFSPNTICIILQSPTLCPWPLQSLKAHSLVALLQYMTQWIQRRADLTMLRVVTHFKSYQAFSIFSSFVAPCTHSHFCPHSYLYKVRCHQAPAAHEVEQWAGFTPDNSEHGITKSE